jgi:DNA-binding NarL/FixJ family response regulator
MSGWQDFDRARTLMVKGALLRRTRDRRGARLVLAEALRILDSMGCSAWASRARSELARAAPGRHAIDGLTPTEAQVAMLCGSGLTNREVATRLFVSPKTVEANLSRIYLKLGIRSRAELGALVARDELGEIPLAQRD